MNAAGYSGTPLLKKLGVKPGSLIRLVNPPGSFLEWLAVQDDRPVMARESDKADVVVLFTEWQEHLIASLPAAIEGLQTNGGLWISWPKKASKVPTDITEDTLRDIILPLGLVDNKVCAVDEKWSGLRFVWRVELRADK